MRVETLKDGTKILCHHILPKGKIKVGSKWRSGSDICRVVTIVNVDEHSGWVEYVSADCPDRLYAKDWFSFQCRYCLILDSDEVPDYVFES